MFGLSLKNTFVVRSARWCYATSKNIAVGNYGSFLVDFILVKAFVTFGILFAHIVVSIVHSYS